MADKLLYKTKWLSLIDRDGYIMVKDATENAVAVLAFRTGETGETQYLARIEPLPAHNPNRHSCALTGSIEAGEAPDEAAARELYEESGYRNERGFISLGRVFPSKASSTTMHLYAIDVTGQLRASPPGDGTKIEEESTTIWLSRRRAMMVPDSNFCAMMARLSLVLEDRLLAL